MVAARFSIDEPAADVGTLAWPLAGSLLVTGVVVAFVCGPPFLPLRSWGQLFSLAVVYLMVAACVHALAVWAICKARRDESNAADWPLIWKIVWGAWIAVVWLPLMALLTREHSPWVALIVPVTAIFAMLFLKWQSRQEEADVEVGHTTPELFQIEDSPPILRVLLPAVFSSIATQAGVGLLVVDHCWLAGGCFAAGSVYPFERLWNARGWRERGVQGRSSRRASTGNSVLALLLTAAALVPFLRTAFAAGLMGELLGSRPAAAATAKTTVAAHKSRGYEGVILLLPPKPHPIVAPIQQTDMFAFGKPHEIEFDGVYWYFKQPDTGPDKDARVAHGDPAKELIYSTDRIPLMMEAHQRLGTSIAMSCCRSLKLRVKNADTVPGTIAVEIVLRDIASKPASRMSLGTIVLPSSTVSPMPLQRAPVEDTVTFQFPRTARGKSFNEITVKIKPDMTRSLAGAKVSIQSFVLQP